MLIKTNKILINLTIFFILLIYSISCLASTKNNDYSNFVIAKVNNKIITNDQLNSRIRYITKSAKLSITNEIDRKLLREQIIDKMIDEELIRQEGQKLQISVANDELLSAYEISALQKKMNVVQFKIFLKNLNIDIEDFNRYLESEIVWNKMINELFVSKIKVSDIEIFEFLEQGKSRSDHRKFLIAEIVISKINNGNKITEEFVNKIYSDLNKGADFEELVRQFSSSSSSAQNGLLGWVSQGDIDVKIYSAIASLNKNGYSKPIPLADGYHIFKLLDAKVEKNIDENQNIIIKKIITKNKLNNFAKGYLIDIRKKSFIEIQ